jgi:hypothetical protein
MPGAKRTAWPALAVPVTERALLREPPACGYGHADLVAAPHLEGSRPVGRGRPPAPESASCPPRRMGSGKVAPASRAMPRCSRIFVSELGRGRTAERR